MPRTALVPRRFRLPAADGSILPGLALALGLALLALALQRAAGIPGLGPMILGVGLGIVLRTCAGPIPQTGPGLRFAMRRLLRLGIVLLGLQVTVAQVAAVGLGGLVAITLTLALTFVVTRAVGRAMGVDGRLCDLIAAGTAVCGASAILAANTVTRGRDEDVAYAVACITLLGTASMLLLPLLAAPLGLTPEIYGLWVGASVHEVAQVVGAAFAQGDVAGQSGTVAKIARVMLLAPLVMAMGLMAARRGGGSTGRAPMPWFALGFIAMILLNSVIDLPDVLRQTTGSVTTVLLTVALVAMGLETDLSRLRAVGLRPLLLGVFATLFVSATALVLILLLAA
ncbi:YeiH family protein [Szabonella alba]|nr:putative sulfate exporter family transporter [Szabonella alba]